MKLRDIVKKFAAKTGGPVVIIEAAVGCSDCGRPRPATILQALHGGGPLDEPASIRKAKVASISACKACGRPKP